MANAAEILINQSVLENRTVKTNDAGVYEDLLVECDNDCDTSDVQVGLTADDQPIMGVDFWGETESGATWRVQLVRD